MRLSDGSGNKEFAGMLIDAHTHLDRYEAGLEDALREIESNRILTVSNSMNIPSYERNLGIAGRCRLVLPIFGVHPWNASGYERDLDSLKPHINRSPMLGEIGLDYHFVKHRHRYPAQRKVFEHFLAAAADQDKIVNLHTKGAEGEVLELLDRYGIRRAIVHWYSGPLDIFREMTARGIYFTVGVEVMHSELIRTIAGELPENLLLTETDNPGGLKWLSGSVGMPSALLEVVSAVAEVRQTTPEAVAGTVHNNFLDLVRDDPHTRTIASTLEA
jgi:TatD DNase family protein